jgi:hypothetical protein
MKNMNNERTKVAGEILGHLKALSAVFLELQRVETETAVAAGCTLGDAAMGAQQYAHVSTEYNTQLETWQRHFNLIGITS